MLGSEEFPEVAGKHLRRGKELRVPGPVEEHALGKHLGLHLVERLEVRAAGLHKQIEKQCLHERALLIAVLVPSGKDGGARLRTSLP